MLPASARLPRTWWENESSGYGHSQALAWSVAGWEMAEVDMDSETLLLRRHRLLTFNTANSSCYEDRIEPVGG